MVQRWQPISDATAAQIEVTTPNLYSTVHSGGVRRRGVGSSGHRNRRYRCQPRNFCTVSKSCDRQIVHYITGGKPEDGNTDTNGWTHAEEHHTSASLLEVDVEGYTAGYYIVRIADENGERPTLKFIKNKYPSHENCNESIGLLNDRGDVHSSRRARVTHRI